MAAQHAAESAAGSEATQVVSPGTWGGVGAYEPVQAFLGGLEPYRVGVDPGQYPPDPPGHRAGGLL